MEYSPELAKKVVELSQMAKNENRYLLTNEVLKALDISYFYNIDGDLSRIISEAFFVLEYYNLYYNKGYRNQGSLIEAIFIEKTFAVSLFSEIISELLVERKNPIVLVDLQNCFIESLENYFGLHNTMVRGCDMELLCSVIEARPDVFTIYKKSSLEESTKHTVGLVVWDDKSNMEMQFLSEMINIIRNSGTTNFQRVLLKINLLPKDFGIPKPYKKDEILKLIQNYPHILSVNNNEITLEELTSSIRNFSIQKTPIRMFKKNYDVPGLIIVFFTGQIFPISEATNYVNLRPAIYFQVVSNLNEEFEDIFSNVDSHFYKTLAALTQENDLDSWIESNLSATFILEDYDYLKLNFDKLMQEYSPVLNLDKNPGNLFRGIIEEKIREYESDKKS